MNQIDQFEFETEWINYGLAFSFKKPEFNRFLISSFNESQYNTVLLSEFDKKNKKFERIESVHLKYISGKLQFFPKGEEEYFVTCGSFLKVWKIDQDNRIHFKQDLIPFQQNPVLSYDINEENVLVTAELNRTCSQWDMNKNILITQFYSHNDDVLDVAFSGNKYIYYSVSGDGQCRLQDFRKKLQVSLFFQNSNRLTKIVCHKNSNYIAVVQDIKPDILVLDDRKPGAIIAQLKKHQENVNAVAYGNEKHLYSVSDDGLCLKWNINTQQIVTEHFIGKEINNLTVNPHNRNEIGICYQNRFKILKFDD